MSNEAGNDVIEISEANWKFKIKGQMVELRQASVEETFKYEEKLEKLGDKNGKKSYEVYMDYIVNLGGDEKLFRSLSLNGFMEVIRAVSGLGKKK